MKILMGKGAVLNTETGLLGPDTEFNINKIGIPVIFNIKKINGKEYCSLSDSKKVIPNVPLDKAKAFCKSKKLEPYIVTEEIKQNVQKPTKIEIGKVPERNKTKEMGPTKKLKDLKINAKEKFTTQDFSKEKSDAQRARIVKKNMSRIVDFTGISNNLSDIASKAHFMVTEALRIIRTHFPYYFHILTRLDQKYEDKDVNDPTAIINTLGVTTSDIAYNSNFIVSRTQKELVFLLCHEASHIALKHHARLMKRNQKLYNIAGDLLINKLLAEEFKVTPGKSNAIAEFPAGSLYNSKVNTKVDTTDTIYNDLVASLTKRKDIQEIAKLVELLVQKRFEVERIIQNIKDPVKLRQIKQQCKIVDESIITIQTLLEGVKNNGSRS